MKIVATWENVDGIILSEKKRTQICIYAMISDTHKLKNAYLYTDEYWREHGN